MGEDSGADTLRGKGGTIAKQRLPTLQTVADAAGVHRSTAARALNDDTRALISPAVVQRIVIEAERLGYRRDVLASSLRSGRSRLIGVVFPDIDNPMFGQILTGITEVVTAKGYSVLVSNAASDSVLQSKAVAGLIARRADGLILATSTRDDPVVAECLLSGIPTVLVNRSEDVHRTPTVVPDDMSGMALAVRHLVSLGHTQIGHLAGPQATSTGHLRELGFRSAMLAAGLSSDAVIRASSYSRSAGQNATRDLLNAHAVTAIAASNDLLALGAYLCLKEMGLRCPSDISIIGHNDMPLVDMIDPPMTTVRIGQVELGREAGDAVLKVLAGMASPTHVMMPSSLVVRQSTAPPQA